jgi:hypothetical protein
LQAGEQDLDLFFSTTFKNLKLYRQAARPISLYLNGEQWLVLQIAIYKCEAEIAAWAHPNDRTMPHRLGQDVVALLRKIRKSGALTDPVLQDSAHTVTGLSFSRRGLINISLAMQYFRSYLLPSAIAEIVKPDKIAKCGNVYQVVTEIEKALERLLDKTSPT